jgi:valyl-tRNA synthetase
LEDIMETTETQAIDGMPKAYDPALYEQRLYAWWEAQGYFKPETQVQLGQAAPDAPTFVISMPPPNVTGILHMGHALTAALEDLMIRYHRLKGDRTLWVPGSDHAGIATQNVVERMLAKAGTDRQTIGRAAFLERAWEWANHHKHRIADQHRRLGTSCDWERERFTLDAGLSRAVNEAFVRFYEQGLIYRGLYLVTWCPRCMSVISDIEVEYRDEQGKLYEFRYPLEGGGFIPVCTTRPETILGDTAVAVHPDDDRYRAVVGRTALVPMLGRPIPVIADPYVDREFGTGALKITPGHDPNDYEIGRQHGLAQINILNQDGTLAEAAGPYTGLDRYEARDRLWADMRAAGLVVGESDHTHSVGHCSRCQTIVEPILSTQWFVKMKPLAEAGIAAVRRGDTRILPDRFSKEYFHWLENIRDWVISRQLWWGHQIPVWYGPDGTAFCARDETAAALKARSHYGHDVAMTRDEDVLDTWFSSGLWPFSTLGWPEETEDLRTFYPTSVLETGYDIVFFWVARMITMGLAITEEVPFHTVYLHGLIRDTQGRKVSKSLGNNIDPIEMVGKYGCDAVRFTLATGATPGVDIRMSDERFENSRNFCNKLWNVARFILMNLGDGYTVPAPSTVDARWPVMALADRWIWSRHNAVIRDVTRLIEGYQFGEAGRTLYEFTWFELADWYVEAAKPALNGPDPARAETARMVLGAVLERTLTLLHPFAPFVTEAIWGHLPKAADAAPALIVSRWPTPLTVDEAAEADFALLQEIVRSIRNTRAEYEVEPGRRIAAGIRADERADMLREQAPVLAFLARLDPDQLAIGADLEPPAAAHATLVVAEGVEVWLPLAGMVDLARERARLAGEAEQARLDLARLQGHLANDNYVTRAPATVVQRDRDRLAETEARLASIAAKLASLGG